MDNKEFYGFKKYVIDGIYFLSLLFELITTN